MNITRKVRTAAALTALAALVPAVGATAADTDVTLEVTSDSDGLSISVPEGSTAELDSVSVSFDSAGQSSGALAPTTVTDGRGGLTATAWDVQVAADGTFSADGVDVPEGEPIPEIPLDGVSVYLPITDLGNITETVGGALSGMTITDGEIIGTTANLGTPYTLLSGSTTGLLDGLTGTPSVTYTPSIDVDVPVMQPPGTYTLTVQQTVSGS